MAREPVLCRRLVLDGSLKGKTIKYNNAEAHLAIKRGQQVLFGSRHEIYWPCCLVVLHEDNRSTAYYFLSTYPHEQQRINASPAEYLKTARRAHYLPEFM